MQVRDWTSQLAEMERRIECLEGVRASRIVPTPGHKDIEEIHIIAHPGRRPKQIVRDVESLLFVDFGCPIDYRRISLVQISEENFTTTWAKRPRLISVESISPEQSTVKVTLMKGNGEEVVALYTAKGEEPLTSVAAKACLRAVKKILTEATDEAAELKLKGMEWVSIADRDALFSWVTARVSSTTHELLGACFVREDELTTAASTVLDAVNRRFLGG